MWVRSAHARSCSSRLRCGGTSSLPQAHSGENGARAAAMWASVGVVCRHRRAACGQVTTGLREGAVRAVPKAATHRMEPGRASSRGAASSAPCRPYRHTTATPHAAVRISMRYRLCAGGYLWCCADCVRCGALRVRCAAGERRERDRHRCRWVGIAAGRWRHCCRDGRHLCLAALLPGRVCVLLTGCACMSVAW